VTRVLFAPLLFLEKAYSYIFFVLMSFFIDEWRALVLMVVVQCIALEALIFAGAIVAGHTPLLIPKLNIALGCLIVYGMTAILIHQRRWLGYKEEFKKCSKKRRKAVNIAVWCLIVLVTAAGVSTIKDATGAPKGSARNRTPESSLP
jgi:hypothetical protein